MSGGPVGLSGFELACNVYDVLTAHPDERWRGALRDEAAVEVWNAPPELTELRVGDAQLPEIVDLADGRKVLLKHATIGQWVDGIGFALHAPPRDGHEIARVLLERAGNDLTAKIIDHIDR